jgi:chlorite dismutase
MTDKELENTDISEKGRSPDGQTISFDRRLFMQLLAYGSCHDTDALVSALQREDIRGVAYEDVNDPQGIALLTFAEEPDYFVTAMRRFLNQPPFSQLRAKPEYTMLGRTYAMGYEPDLEEALINRPRYKVTNPDNQWAIWYPLRRSGTFESLSAQEQRVVLMEHGGIGRAFGKAGYGTDIRLATHGLDKNDNDFVIGLVGPELFPLSRIVERMRKTKQTSMYLERLGPFFIGRVLWQQSATNE